MFTDELGERLHPDHLSRRFRELAKAASLPVIKFHAARHSAAAPTLEAGVDIKIVSEQLGHSTTRITQDMYQHVRLQVHQDSAEKSRLAAAGGPGTASPGHLIDDHRPGRLGGPAGRPAAPASTSLVPGRRRAWPVCRPAVPFRALRESAVTQTGSGVGRRRLSSRPGGLA